MIDYDRGGEDRDLFLLRKYVVVLENSGLLDYTKIKL